ncbi:MAG: tyrosine-type recombinase/integrase [Eubacteriales bacterium]
MEAIYSDSDKKLLSDILLEFSSYKTVIQGCSVKTVKEYLLDLSIFARFIMAKRSGISPESDEFDKIDISKADAEFFKSIKTPEIYEFLLYAGTVRKNMWAAKARKLSAIKALYKFMTTKKNMQFENPAISIESPKPKKALPKFLTLDESISLLEAIQNDKESKTRLRDFAIVTLFLNCGMRLSELVGINLHDLDRELRSLRVVGKGNKERIVYLNTACKEALLEYLKWRLAEDRTRLATKALFLSNRNQRISIKTVQWMVYKYLNAAGLGSKRYSVHKLRHTAATLMYQSGEVDVRVLKDILGHEQLNTTQIYTHVSNAAMSEAMEKNPLAHISIGHKEKQKD